MPPRFAVACWFLLASLSGGLAAQSPVPAALASPGLRQAALDGASSVFSDIEIRSTAHLVTVVVMDSSLAVADALGRGAEAASIASAIERAMSGRPEYAGVMSIHVDFVDRESSRMAAPRGFEFNRTPSGSFVGHRS